MRLGERARGLHNRRRVENVLHLGARQRALATDGEAWDREPWRLPCADGVIDLTTGVLLRGHPEEWLRSGARVGWEGLDAPAVRWEQFLMEVFKGDDELLRFVQRLLGCALAGLVHEHVLPIFWGSGRNGKGTLLEVVAGVLGPELAVPVPADALMEQRKGSDGPQPYLYALRGKRLAWASESNEGRRVDAALVKQLTGGDLLHVRTLHGKPVMFEPTHLLLLLTNHKPHLAADDPAVWERVLLVPFTERFVAEPGAGEKQREAGLKEALLAEGAEILAWLVRGCMGWQMLGGLRPPAVVKAATAAYREEEDDLKPFLAERCVQRAECQIAAKLGYTFAAKLVQIVGDDGLSLLRYG